MNYNIHSLANDLSYSARVMISLMPPHRCSYVEMVWPTPAQLHVCVYSHIYIHRPSHIQSYKHIQYMYIQYVHVHVHNKYWSNTCTQTWCIVYDCACTCMRTNTNMSVTKCVLSQAPYKDKQLQGIPLVWFVTFRKKLWYLNKGTYTLEVEGINMYIYRFLLVSVYSTFHKSHPIPDSPKCRSTTPNNAGPILHHHY